MGVKKFTFTEENYQLAKDFLDEILPLPTVDRRQMLRLHEISTILGEPSAPGGCATCNRRARVFIQAYVNEYERIIIRGEDE
jgi:hypothetical protein